MFSEATSSIASTRPLRNERYRSLNYPAPPTVELKLDSYVEAVGTSPEVAVALLPLDVAVELQFDGRCCTR